MKTFSTFDKDNDINLDQFWSMAQFSPAVILIYLTLKIMRPTLLLSHWTHKRKNQEREFLLNRTRVSSNFFILLNKSDAMTSKTNGDQGILLE